MVEGPAALASGRRGYVAARLVRSPIDYRLRLDIDAHGHWWLSHFIAGD